MRLELRSSSNRSGICRFHGNAVQIYIRRGEHLWLPLITADYQMQHLQEWRGGKLKIGEIIISFNCGDRAHVHVPFKQKIEPRNVSGVCGIDINERSVDLCLFRFNQDSRFIKFDVSKLAAVRLASQLKRARMQQKLCRKRPLQMQRLFAKYHKRGRNRLRQYLHEISKRIVNAMNEEDVAPVLENLKNININKNWRKGKKSRNLRRRLNNWPYRKLQSFIEYKALVRGFPTSYVSAKNTSRRCPVCGQLNEPEQVRV